MSNESETEAYLHRHIPLSREMQVSVRSIDEEGVRLAAPLGPNINHRSTVFGGSASAVAILAAWTFVHARLRERGLTSRIVIQRNAMEYLRPIDGEFEAFCPAPPTRSWQRLVDGVERRGRGRITLEVELFAEGEIAGAFSGSYVVMAPEKSNGPDPA
jgi:thioesterase domain-containing protein